MRIPGFVYKDKEVTMKEIKGKATLLLILLLCYPLAAQEINFSGKWLLNQEKTKLGEMPEIVIEISQDEGIINYRKIVKGSSGERVTHMSLSMDGKEGSYTDSRGNQMKCSCGFGDGNLIVYSQSRQRRSGKWVILNIEEEHSLSPDGKTLSIIHTERWGDKGGKWPNPMVFDKLTVDIEDAQDKRKKADSNMFSKQQLIEDARQLLSYLENIHPDPYLYSGGKVAFHRRFQNILQSIPQKGMSKDDFIRLLRPFIAALADAHTALLTTYSYDKTAPGGIPLSFASIEKCLYVQGVPSNKDKALLGAKLLSVEGVPFAEMLKRVYKLRGVENDYHGLLILNTYLWSKPYLKEVLPEWQDTSRISVQLELADGKKQNQLFNLPQKIVSPLINIGSKLELPSTEKCEFVYFFLSPDRKRALLKIDGMTAYREMFESESRSRDIYREAAEAYEKFHGEKAPPDLDAVMAGIPSAVETFRQLVIEMKESGTEALIVDLSQNGGGHSLMADILTYFLYGKQQLAEIISEEPVVTKYSPYFFAQLPGRSIDEINRQYAQIQSYPLTEDDYDFSYERYVDLALSGKMDLETGLELKYAGSPTFLAEIKTGAYAGFYPPKKVIVTTSHGTFSSGFTLLRFLYKSGAIIVGSTSGQSGNGFGNSTHVSLKNTGVKMAVSKNAYVVFPEEPNKRKVIMPHHELTYEKLKGYGFDPNAVILYALELLNSI